jgi:hypothetical protein
VLRQSQTYVTSAGEVVVERTLYKDRGDADGRCVSPMELTLGVIGDFWTPRAAQQALWVVTQMTPKKSAELFKRVGNMTPSKSSLDRLPKLIDERWEEGREDFERALREGLEIPEGSVSIAVSLDGVLAPIDGARSPTEVRALAAEEGRMSKGPPATARRPARHSLSATRRVIYSARSAWRAPLRRRRLRSRRCSRTRCPRWCSRTPN